MNARALKAKRSASAKKGWETRIARERREIEAANEPRAQTYPPPPFVLIHRDCGKPAFGLTERPAPYSLAGSRIARHLDGRPMEPSAAMVCESCGVPISMPRSTDVVEAGSPAPVLTRSWNAEVEAFRASKSTAPTPDPDALDPQQVADYLAKQDPNPWPRLAAKVRACWAWLTGWVR